MTHCQLWKPVSNMSELLADTLKVLGIYPLQQRRLRRDQIEKYKILIGKERVDSQSVIFQDVSRST